jgi:hypothetical protein
MSETSYEGREGTDECGPGPWVRVLHTWWCTHPSCWGRNKQAILSGQTGTRAASGLADSAFVAGACKDHLKPVAGAAQTPSLAAPRDGDDLVGRYWKGEYSGATWQVVERVEYKAWWKSRCVVASGGWNVGNEDVHNEEVIRKHLCPAPQQEQARPSPAAPPLPPKTLKREHRWDRYCADPMARVLLCVDCGQMGGYTSKECEPAPGWREAMEARISAEMKKSIAGAPSSAVAPRRTLWTRDALIGGFWDARGK